MTIPYGGIALLSGVLALVFKAPAVGLHLVGAGMVISLCSVLSIKAWKGSSSSTPYTFICAGGHHDVALTARMAGVQHGSSRGFTSSASVQAVHWHVKSAVHQQGQHSTNEAVQWKQTADRLQQNLHYTSPSSRRCR